MTPKPWLTPSMVAALMTPLMPGAGPPPTRMANLPLLVPFDISIQFLNFVFARFLCGAGGRSGFNGNGPRRTLSLYGCPLECQNLFVNLRDSAARSPRFSPRGG